MREDYWWSTIFFVIDGKKILVLVRHKQFSRQFKLRASGKDGTRFEDEEIHLIANPQKLVALQSGAVIEL